MMDISTLDLTQAFGQAIFYLIYQLGMALAAPLILRSELYWVYFSQAWQSLGSLGSFIWFNEPIRPKVSSKPISARTSGGTRLLKLIIGIT